MKIPVASIFITSIYSQTYDIQIKSSSDLCLSLQQEQLYMSTNESGNRQFSPYAKFKPCDSRNSEQFFHYDSVKKQLSTSNNKCLTIKPLASWAHENNDFCDIWGDFQNVGAYLYVDECKLQNSLSQQFDFVQKSVSECGGSFVSRCGHGFRIGRTGNNMALLVGEGQNFGEVEILEDLEVRNDEFCVIETTIASTTEATTIEVETTQLPSCKKSIFNEFGNLQKHEFCASYRWKNKVRNKISWRNCSDYNYPEKKYVVDEVFDDNGLIDHVLIKGVDYPDKCWSVKNLKKVGTGQTVFLKSCKMDDDRQKWVLENGSIWLKFIGQKGQKFCVPFLGGGSFLKTKRCYESMFG